MGERKLDRRSLLKGAAAAAAVPLFVPATVLGLGGQAGANERVHLGFIGVGGRGSRLIEGFRASKEARPVAFCDCHKHHREFWASQFKGKACADLRELVADKEIDAVVIATPDHWHVPAGLMAVRAGKDVYIEKPLGISVHHGQVMRKEVRDRKRIFQYGTQQRSSAHCRSGCEIVRSGKLGKIERIHVAAPDGRAGGSKKEVPVPAGFDYDMWLGPAPVVPYVEDRCCHYFIYDYAIGYIAGWGAHPLDILVWGFDVRKAGKVRVLGKAGLYPDHLFNTVHTWNLNYEFESGVKMTFVAGENDTLFFGAEGTAKVSRARLEIRPKELAPADLGQGHSHDADTAKHAQNFLDCVKSRKDPVSNIEDAAASDVLSHLGDIAIRVRRPITWDWVKEEIVGDEEASKMLRRPLRAPWTL